MELHQIHCFLAVARTLNFSRASEAVHLSQPALSLQIRGLEEDLGVRLFDRNHARTVLTPAGGVFLEEARLILAQAEKAVTDARMAAAGLSGRLRLGFISTAAAHLIPALVSRFRETHPHVELELRHALTTEQTEMLKARTLDIGFFRVPVSEQGGIRTIPVFREPFKVFLPASHPLAHRRNLRLGDLDGTHFIVYARKHAPGFHDLILDLLKASGAVPAAIHEANDMYTLVSLVSAGVGVAIAPASVEHYRLPEVVVRDIGQLPPSEVALGFREGLENPVAWAFINLTLEAHEIKTAVGPAIHAATS
jgi:DNA-binding transcriptional LysR family regulator